MANNKNFFDDFSKIATSTFASMVNMKNEFSGMIKDQIKSSLRSMDFVSRNEFNALKKLTMEMRGELDSMKKGKAVVKKTASNKSTIKVTKASAKKSITKKVANKKKK